jgi:hypothetical protein
MTQALYAHMNNKKKKRKKNRQSKERPELEGSLLNSGGLL